MKKKILILCVIIAICILCVIVISSVIQKNNYLNIIKSNGEQVKMLSKLYDDFLMEADVGDSTVLFNESALKNLVTREKFDDEDIDKLKEKEYYINNPAENYIMSVQYFPKTNKLTLQINGDKGTIIWQKYKIFVQNDEIRFEKYGDKYISVI